VKIFIYLIISLLILASCGKKSDPKYETKNKQVIAVLS
jgi:PBP1b-binding outer membrane lipoprotein LpoB